MHVVIIEDEKPTALMLQQFVLQYDNNINAGVIIESVQQGIKWFDNNQQPDLIFSDIELLDDNVFVLFRKVSIQCPVVFITAYDKYLSRAFEVNSISYILKPFQYNDLANALRKFKQLRQNFNSQLLSLLPQEFKRKIYKSRFVIKAKGGIILLEASGIVYFQVKNGISYAYNADGKPFIINDNLNKLEELVDPELFFRINRGEMININFIEKIYPCAKECLTIQLKLVKVNFQTSSNRTPEFRKWISR